MRAPRFLAIMLLVVQCHGTVVAADDEAVRVCGTVSPSPSRILDLQGAVRRVIPGTAALRVEAVPVTVPVYWHILQDGTEDKLRDDQIAGQLDVLNQAYAPAGYRFVSRGITRSKNAKWFALLAGDSSEEEVMRALVIDAVRNLNVYIGKPRALVDGRVESVLGYAYFPWDNQAADSWRDGVVLDWTTLPGASAGRYGRGATAVHEVGHWLGLLHTFDNGNNPDGCEAPGDDVADTPAERAAYFGPGDGQACPVVGRDSCPAPGTDPVDNFMDYADDRCMTRFTTGQTYRMVSMTQLYRRGLILDNALAERVLSGL